MAGMDMLLKSFGFNPDDIKHTANQAMQTFNQLAERLQRIEEQQATILEILANGSWKRNERQSASGKAVEKEGTFGGQE
jgi:hypothetical protein